MKTVVLSEDALTDADMPYLKTLPNFRKYIEGGAEVKHVKSVYPSITYPCHTTMATGVYPARHGVICNMPFFRPGDKHVPWLWYHDAVAAPDVFTLAHAAGLVTAAVFWPCTGNHPDIDYLIDEIWSHPAVPDGRAAFIASGTGEELMTVVDRHSPFVERSHPGADTFVVNCAADIVEQYAPDLLMLHPAQIDAYRHREGLFAPKVEQGVREADEHIGVLGRALERRGLLDQTNFILTSDHGQLDIDRIFCPNAFLRERGWLQADETGVTDWTAVCNSGGMCSFVYVRDKSPRTLTRLGADLKQMAPYGVSAVYDREQAAAFGLAGDFSFVLETDGRTSFSDGWKTLGAAAEPDDYRLSFATHGFHPDKGPMPVFYAKGPAFGSASVTYARLVDEAPTIAASLGLTMPDTDGRVLTELLK